MAIDATDIRLPISGSRETRSVAKDIIEVAEADYLYVLRSIAAQEIGQQALIGNRVTNLIVDGSGSKPIDQAQFSVRALFVQPASIMRAVTDAWERIHRLARIGDPLTQAASQRAIVARERFAIVIGQRFIGEPGNLTEQAIMADPGAPVRIVGPLVEYALPYRFLFFLRGMRPTRKAKSRRTGMKERVPLSLHETVVLEMRRRYPMLRWSATWIPTARLRYAPRVPTVTVHAKTTRGAL